MAHDPRLARFFTAATGTLAVAAYAAWAAWQILVLTPLAAVPGSSLGQIHAEMARMGEHPGYGAVITVLGTGVALAIALLVLAIGVPSFRVWAIGVSYLGMLALGAPAHFVASFGPGMSLGDSFETSGGFDYEHGTAGLYAVSGVAAVVLVAFGIPAAMRASRESRAAARFAGIR